jgi:hypothetical protein
MECYNFSFSLALFIALAGVYTSLFTSANPFWFDLGQLQAHNKISIEHDASLCWVLYLQTSFFGSTHAKIFVARRDFKTGDNWHPDSELIKQMLASSSSSNGSLSLEDYAQYRVIRETTLPVPFTGLRSFLATGEVGLILSGIGRDAADAVHVSTIFLVVNQRVYAISFWIKQRKIHAEWAKSFFILSKLPDDWKPQSVPVTLKDVNDVRKKMQEIM